MGTPKPARQLGDTYARQRLQAARGPARCVPMRQRYADLEANMLANLQAMREHREAMDKVKEQRKKDHEKALEEMRTPALEQPSSHCDVSGPLVGVPCVRTLKDRFRAL